MARQCVVCGKTIPQKGKYAKKWDTFKLDWFKRHTQAVMTCGICGLPVKREDVVLDHILPKSGEPQLRYVDSNIQASHWICNGQKGSKRL
jgi:5-methylcytosine-specific restriction endonuclease McrA